MSHYFLPVINQPTRIVSTVSTLVDTIFTNVPRSVVETVGLIVVSDIYDHLPLLSWLNTTQIHCSIVNFCHCFFSFGYNKRLCYVMLSTHKKLQLTKTLDALDNVHASITKFRSNLIEIHSPSLIFDLHVGLH